MRSCSIAATRDRSRHRYKLAASTRPERTNGIHSHFIETRMLSVLIKVISDRPMGFAYRVYAYKQDDQDGDCPCVSAKRAAPRQL